MSKLKVLGKLNPVQYKQMLDHLTKKKIKNPFIDADDIVVNKKPEVEEREVINAFMKRNPINKADGGRAGMLKGGLLLSKGIMKALEQIKNMDETNVFSKLNSLGKAKTIRDALTDRIKGFKNIIKDLKKEGRPIDEIEDFKFEIDEAKDSLEKINEYIKNQPTNRTLQAQGGRIGFDDGGMLVQPGFGGTRQGYADKKYKRFKKTVNIDGKQYGIITKENDPNFGKYVYRGNKGNEYFDEIDDLKARIEKGGKGRKFTGFSKGYLAELEDIKKFVDDKGAKNIFLSDLVEKFGDVTKETSDEAVRDSTTEKKIKRAIGDDEYKKLIRGGQRKKTSAEKKKKFNKLIKDIYRGDEPIISLSSEITGEAPNVLKDFLNKTERKMYDTLIPKLKAIVSRVTQPRQIYEGTNAIEELKNTTTKTYNKTIKKYPQALAARNILTSGKGIVAYNDKSYILSQLFRHVQNGGTKYKYVSGDTTATIKFRNTETGKLISLNNIDVKNPEFKEAANIYNQKERIMNTEIDDPRKKGAKIKIGQAIAANGDSLVIDHLDDVKNNPLKNLAITNQKANMAATIKGATEAELKSIGRGLKLSLEDNIKRYSNYAKRLLISPDKKRPGPKETIFKKERTLRGVTDPPDPELKKLVSLLGGENCGREFKNQGGRIGLQDGTPNVDVCFKKATQRINSGFKNATPAEARNYTKLLNAVKGSAVIGKNLLKFGIVPEALFVGADTLFRMGYGDTFKEAGLRAADFFIPGDQMQEADKLKVQRTLGDAVATNVGRVFDYRNQIAKIDNLQSQKQNLENLSDVGEFDYIGDLSQDVKNIDMNLNQAKNDLQNKFMVSEAETVAADQALEEAYDISKAKSPFARLQLFARNIEGVKDDPFLSDIATPEKTQMDLNLNMFPPMQTDFMKMTDTDIINRRRQLIDEGYDLPSSRQLMADRDKEVADMKSRSLLSFPREQVFGAQGTFFGQPLAGGGIAKIAGVDQGPPPESGPNPQGLQGLMKRVRNR